MTCLQIWKTCFWKKKKTDLVKNFLCKWQINLREDCTLKIKFWDVNLDRIWISLEKKYPVDSSGTAAILLPFFMTYLCEVILSSHVKSISSTGRSDRWLGIRTFVSAFNPLLLERAVVCIVPGSSFSLMLSDNPPKDYTIDSHLRFLDVWLVSVPSVCSITTTTTLPDSKLYLKVTRHI